MTSPFDSRMDTKVFAEFCAIAYEQAGIRITDGKEALVRSRVSARVRALGLADEAAYCHHLRTSDSTEMVEFLNAITTNFTHFAREPVHFEVLSTWAQRQSALERPLNIWCAAASTGQEPYNIAFTMLDAMPDRGNFRILATDISTRALEACARGRYTTELVSALPSHQASRYFQRAVDGQDELEVTEEVRRFVHFGRLNLAKTPFPMRGPLDVVFCRNVMIYFDKAVKQGLISEVERLLSPGGLLFIGHAETLSGLQTRLRLVRPAIYRKPFEPGPQ